MIRRTLAAIAAALAIALVAASGTTVVTGQLLAYEDGFVFFTTGDGFRVAPNVAIKDATGKTPTMMVPAPRVWARATFDATGTVVELDLSREPLKPEGSFADVSRFAVALSTPVPNPDLVPASAPPGEPTPKPGASAVPHHVSGNPVLVTFVVQVPPNTPFTASVYITTDQSGWNAQAIPMTRIDTLHYEITRRLAPGTVFRYLYDRGSLNSQEIAENGLQRNPRMVAITNADVRVVRDTVYAWLDQTAGGYNQTTNAIPTPYNPAPFPNLPNNFPTPCAKPPKC